MNELTTEQQIETKLRTALIYIQGSKPGSKRFAASRDACLSAYGMMATLDFESESSKPEPCKHLNMVDYLGGDGIYAYFRCADCGAVARRKGDNPSDPYSALEWMELEAATGTGVVLDAQAREVGWNAYDKALKDGKSHDEALKIAISSAWVHLSTR